MRRHVWWCSADPQQGRWHRHRDGQPVVVARLFPTLLALSLLLAACAAGSPARAATVTDVTVKQHDGQVFVTWTNCPGSGWRYHVYALTAQPGSGESVLLSTRVGSCGDSSAVDRRLSRITGQLETFRVDSTEAPLEPTKGLFVRTVEHAGTHWYAVTTDSAGIEDSTIEPGVNAASEATEEIPARVRPVWQRSNASPQGEIYVLWGGNVDTPTLPALANAPNQAFLLGVKRGAPGGPLVVHGHGRGGTFFNSFVGAGLPGENVIAPDDHLDTEDGGSWYFGFHAGYDMEEPLNAPPTSGTVLDFGERRVLALMDWSALEMGHDPNRVYTLGSSMGGTFSVLMAWHHPERIAAGWAQVPKVSFARSADEQYWTRFSWDRLWGSIDFDLPCSNGFSTYEWLDPARLAASRPDVVPAPLLAFVGRMDDFTGWMEKLAYMHLVDSLHVGGAFFWDTRVHAGSATAAWLPMHDPSWIGRFALNRSYPAFSHCSAAGDVGTGSRTDGDSVGTTVGALDWEANVTDEPDGWAVLLRTRELHTRWDTIPAPESLVVDVTPRRVQVMDFEPWSGYSWRVVRAVDGAILQTGWTATDQYGRLTVPGVKVMRAGCRLEIGEPSSIAGTPPPRDAGIRWYAPATLSPGGRFGVSWPGREPARVDLVDVTGRRVARVFEGVPSGTASLAMPDGARPGVYWLRAEQGARRATRRVIVLR